MVANTDDDILNSTPPAGIPGALYAAMLRRTMNDYKPGTIISTAAGCGVRAQTHVIALLELMTAFYEEVAAQENGG